jgi:hypothetical protein
MKGLSRMKETPELLLTNQLDELAAFEPAGYPFSSVGGVGAMLRYRV